MPYVLYFPDDSSRLHRERQGTQAAEAHKAAAGNHEDSVTISENGCLQFI